MLSAENRNDIIALKRGFLANLYMDKKKSSGGGKLPKIFDKVPELKKRAEDYLAQTPPAKKEEDYQKFQKFISGEMTWAEIQNYPKKYLKEIARLAYLKFKMGDFRVSESLFKGLSIMDHLNWYYRAALGAVYQKQKLYEQAIEEYSMALTINEKEITSLTNRGECHMHLQNFSQAVEDFKRAVNLDPAERNSWGKRAKVLLKKLTDEGHVSEETK